MTAPDAAARLARRYPPPSRRRWWIPVAILLAMAGVAWLVWAGGYGAADVTARVDAFTVQSDSQIDVTLTIDRPDPSRGAQCQLYAQAVSYDRVGELTVTVPPGGERLTQQHIELRTFKRATTAVVDSCHVT